MTAVDDEYTNVRVSIVFQVRHGPEWSQAEKRHTGDHQHAESLAQRAQEEPVPDQRRENHVGDHHQDDAHPGQHVVRKRQKTVEKGEQNDLGAQEQGRRRGQQQRG